ncbi:MAG: hypothetical protein LC808_19170 [Actinobacteria bacterium]|nr:hypothetical protein [Actinomycetota bacterium]
MRHWCEQEGQRAVPTEAELTGRINHIKAQLVVLGDLRPGALSEQYNTCRSAGCRCKADPPHRHGPYHQLSYRRRGRSTTENVRPEHVAAVQAQIANYRRLRDLIDEWVDAAVELDRLRRAPAR